jgi:hypothetical protein
MGKTFKEVNDGSNVEKIVKKVGLSLGIIFSKEEQIKFNIKYGSVIRLNNAEIVLEENVKGTKGL